MARTNAGCRVIQLHASAAQHAVLRRPQGSPKRGSRRRGPAISPGTIGGQRARERMRASLAIANLREKLGNFGGRAKALGRSAGRAQAVSSVQQIRKDAGALRALGLACVQLTAGSRAAISRSRVSMRSERTRIMK